MLFFCETLQYCSWTVCLHWSCCRRSSLFFICLLFNLKYISQKRENIESTIILSTRDDESSNFSFSFFLLYQHFVSFSSEMSGGAEREKRWKSLKQSVSQQKRRREFTMSQKYNLCLLVFLIYIHFCNRVHNVLYAQGEEGRNCLAQ